MKPKRSFWKSMLADWKPTLIIALPIFALAMWYAMARNYSDLIMYGVVLALASWHVAGMAVLTYRKFMALRKQHEEKYMPGSNARTKASRSDRS